ncbi:venom peptide BmKAPI-like [Leptidea sinapis]|uniref:venom peptide BmKAPI-like n=1 Tax=Leptidea sinapis TaxID=189913 RepID=UPI00213ADDA3|nr:venom peptide BmKAPI-like [Leptidea sinapis]
MMYKYLAVFLLCFVLTETMQIEEKPWECPENELYFKCQKEVCWKQCQDLKKPPPCPSIAPGCYDPACLCKENYLRNELGVCVHEDECFWSTQTIYENAISTYDRLIWIHINLLGVRYQK